LKDPQTAQEVGHGRRRTCSHVIASFVTIIPGGPYIHIIYIYIYMHVQNEICAMLSVVYLMEYVLIYIYIYIYMRFVVNPEPGI